MSNVHEIRDGTSTQGEEARTVAMTRRSRSMTENGSEEGLLLVRAEPLGLAEEISQRMVDVVRLVDGALLLGADLAWAGAINTVLLMKGVRVSELRHLSRPQQISYWPTARQRSSPRGKDAA
jgi:hypothetical protein